jgi:uncharacterized protein
MDKKRLWLISTAVLAATLIFVGFMLKTPYKQQISTQQWITNTVSVAWEGKSLTSPDTLSINIQISELGKTTKEAQDKANEKITKIKEILKEFDIPKQNIQTTNINVYTEYDRTKEERKLLGYRSQQDLNIKVQWEGFAEKGGNIMNKISEVGEINVNNVNFIVDDKTKAMEEAREKAFNDATEKAKQLARLWGLSLGKPTMITEQEIQYYYDRPMYAKEMAMDAGAGNTMNEATLSPGQLELTARVNIVYEIK